MSADDQYPSTHTEALAAREERKRLFIQIAQRLAQVQTEQPTPLRISALLDQVATDLSAPREQVAAVFWELARRGYFDLDAKPLFTLPVDTTPN